MNKITKNKTGMRWLVLIILISLISGSSCKKLIETPPPTNLIAENNVYTNDAASVAVLNGLYTTMNFNNQPFQGTASIALFSGLGADELTLYSGVTNPTTLGFYKNALSVNPVIGSDHWTNLYVNVFRCNSAIEGLNKSTSLTPVIKQQLLGEAKFMRAFFYFYLVNEFGDVPLALTTDPEINTLLARSSITKVYDQIIADLKDAQELLSVNYLDGTLLNATTERIRPTKWAATAMLARVYLYTNKFDKAETEATSVINNATLYGPLPSLNNAFLKNSREAIWQLQPTAINFNTQEARTLVLLPPSAGPNASANPVYLSNNLLNSFEVNDQRAVDGNWINSRTVGTTTYRFAYKYKVNASNPNINNQLTGPQFMTEYFMVLRLGEQYLIRAEARAQQGNVSGAQSDLNTIRTRAGLTSTTASDKPSLLTAILKERQVELFCEWGNRWFDLKRTNNIDAVMTLVTPVKSNGTTTWQPYQALYPLLKADLDKAPNLVQNPGY